MRNIKTAIAALILLAVAFLTIPLGSTASATTGEDHKVWVCHATSGQGELKNGYNLIHVDIASTQGEAHLAHATTDPKDNKEFGTLYDYIDVDPEDLPGKCGVTPPVTTLPPVVTTTQPPVVSVGTAPPPPTPPPFTPTATEGDKLPATGNSTGLIALIAVATLGAGAAITGLSRRKVLNN